MPRRRHVRAMLERLTESAKTDRIRLRAIELIMLIDRVSLPEQINTRLNESSLSCQDRPSDLLTSELYEPSTLPCKT